MRPINTRTGRRRNLPRGATPKEMDDYVRWRKKIAELHEIEMRRPNRVRIATDDPLFDLPEATRNGRSGRQGSPLE